MGNRMLNNNNSSGYAGVHFIKHLNKWTARIGINNKRLNLGFFETAEQAGVAKKLAEIEYGKLRVLKPRTEAHSRAISESRERSPAVRVHMIAMNAAKKGSTLTEEHKRKIGLAGIGRIKSPETRAKIGAIHKGKIVSPESRLKMSIAKKGKPSPLRGDKNPNWRGGITALHTQIRRLDEYKYWRTAVYERDDYTCRVCLGRGGRLEADHCNKPFSIILAENGIKTTGDAIACNELWDTDNGQTLCYGCHRVKSGKQVDYIRKQIKMLQGRRYPSGLQIARS
jgi:5-methylcytosine-specific restriction endonuclease McrA